LHKALPWLIAAHLVAGMADQALLVVALGILVDQGHGFWWAPLLKMGYTTAYVVLAPWVGQWVDRASKAEWMVRTHWVKALAVAAVLCGLPLLIGFAVVGAAAAIYAPARYGWVTEVTREADLVRANAWQEAGLVGSAIFGTVLGGLLLSPAWHAGAESMLHMDSALSWLGLHAGALAALVVLALFYVAAGCLNQLVPCSGWHTRMPVTPMLKPWAVLQAFYRANCRLWGDAQGGQLALAATALFWGIGAALQMIVLQWATTNLSLPLHQAAYLQGVVAVGMVSGALLAGRFVPLRMAHKLLPVGVLLGVLVPVAAMTHDVAIAATCLALAGAAGGFTVIPLNALLQSRGLKLLTPGLSMAVQAFNENASILAMLAGYAVMARIHVTPVGVMWMLGAAVSLSLLSLMRLKLQKA